MFRHNKIALAAFAALFISLAAGSARAQDWHNAPSGSEAVNPYGTLEMQESGTALLDAINRDYPRTLSTTFYNPLLLDNMIEDSTTLVDRVDAVSPQDTSATIGSPVLLDNMIEESQELVDRVNTVDSSADPLWQ